MHRVILLTAMILTSFCQAGYAQGTRSPADQAQEWVVSMVHTEELAQVCQWTSEPADQLHRDAQRMTTSLLQARVLRGQLTPIEAVDAQSSWLLPISFRLLAREALDWKADGECQDADWRKAWLSFVEARKTVPIDSPLLIRVPEESRQNALRFKVQSCLTEATMLLDDRISGAEVVANAVRNACRDELLEQLTQNLSSGGTAPQSIDYRATQLLQSQSVLQAVSARVLEVRASRPASK